MIQPLKDYLQTKNSQEFLVHTIKQLKTSDINQRVVKSSQVGIFHLLKISVTEEDILLTADLQSWRTRSGIPS